jgi:hypothetical protein
VRTYTQTRCRALVVFALIGLYGCSRANVLESSSREELGKQPLADATDERMVRDIDAALQPGSSLGDVFAQTAKATIESRNNFRRFSLEILCDSRHLSIWRGDADAQYRVIQRAYVTRLAGLFRSVDITDETADTAHVTSALEHLDPSCRTVAVRVGRNWYTGATLGTNGKIQDRLGIMRVE